MSHEITFVLREGRVSPDEKSDYEKWDRVKKKLIESRYGGGITMMVDFDRLHWEHKHYWRCVTTIYDNSEVLQKEYANKHQFYRGVISSWCRDNPVHYVERDVLMDDGTLQKRMCLPSGKIREMPESEFKDLKGYTLTVGARILGCSAREIEDNCVGSA